MAIAQAEEVLPLSTTTVKEMVIKTAERHSLNVKMFDAVVRCESSYDWLAVGDHSTSIGVAQINLPSHPTVSREMAENPQQALEWMANKWDEGQENIWTCYRLLK